MPTDRAGTEEERLADLPVRKRLGQHGQDFGNSNKDGAGATGAFGAAIGVKIRDDVPS